MILIVEKTDPYAVHPHLTDERHEETAATVAERIDDLTGLGASAAEEMAAAALGLGFAVWIDPESGVQVEVRPDDG